MGKVIVLAVSGYVNGRCTAFVSVNFQNQLPACPAEVPGGFLGEGLSLSLSSVEAVLSSSRSARKLQDKVQDKLFS